MTGNLSTDRGKRGVVLGAAVAAALAEYVIIFAGSARGLNQFAEQRLHLHGHARPSVALALDFAAVMAATFAVYGRMRGRYIAGAYPMVLAAVGISAWLNYANGGGNVGLYYAALSVLGIWMFHLILAQVAPDQVAVARRRPAFGARWLLAPWSTFGALRTWIVDPPPADTQPTVRAALQHRATVRSGRRPANTAAMGWGDAPVRHGGAPPIPAVGVGRSPVQNPGPVQNRDGEPALPAGAAQNRTPDCPGPDRAQQRAGRPRQELTSAQYLVICQLARGADVEGRPLTVERAAELTGLSTGTVKRRKSEVLAQAAEDAAAIQAASPSMSATEAVKAALDRMTADSRQRRLEAVH
jgi:hypothetical protein